MKAYATRRSGDVYDVRYENGREHAAEVTEAYLDTLVRQGVSVLVDHGHHRGSTSDHDFETRNQPATPPELRYYACSWTSGVAHRKDPKRTGGLQRDATYYSFPSRQERDTWVDAGPKTRTERGFREAISADDAELRRKLQEDDLDQALESPHQGTRVVRVEVAREQDLEPSR